MKIAITGASGFIGINLTEYLKPFYDLSRRSIRYRPNQSFNIEADVVIHMAGKAHDLKKVSHPHEYYEANFELTKQLFDAFLESQASVFIFLSTVKAVADQVKGILKEGEVPNPKTHYGISKYMAEKYILSRELPIGKRAYILRPCMIHGPGNKGNLNLLYQTVMRGLPWPLGAFENRRSYLSVENLCFVIKELLENESAPSGIYNVADDGALSTNELVKLIASSQNRKIIVLNLSAFVIHKIASLGDFFRLPFNSERLQKLTQSYVVSNAKILEVIGKPLPIGIEQGLLQTFRSFNKPRKL